MSDDLISRKAAIAVVARALSPVTSLYQLIEDELRALSPTPVDASPAPDPSDKVREAAMVPEIAALIEASRRITEADWVYTSMTDDLCNAMLALDAIAGGDA